MEVTKMQKFQEAAQLLFEAKLRLIDLDINRPWGFFLSVDESQSEEFIGRFYKDITLNKINSSLPLRPKLLGFAPGKRLSWQYHHRRAEVWRCLEGEFRLITSTSDIEEKSEVIKVGQVVNMDQGVRHRSVGLNNWSLVAEIWQHTDSAKPSDENDIVRLQDDFGRK